MTTERERFLAKVDKNGPLPAHCPELGPCHLWLAARDRHGYGKTKLLGKPQYAHRAAFFLAHGRWPEPFGLHRCDNPSCVNEAHLFEGTQADNLRDCRLKGRHAFGDRNGLRKHPGRAARGEQSGAAKLTEADIRAIRDEYRMGGVSQRELGRRYCVTQNSIYKVVHHIDWRHV